jgi:hypothetical protein
MRARRLATRRALYGFARHAGPPPVCAAVQRRLGRHVERGRKIARGQLFGGAKRRPQRMRQAGTRAMPELASGFLGRAPGAQAHPGQYWLRRQTTRAAARSPNRVRKAIQFSLPPNGQRPTGSHKFMNYMNWEISQRAAGRKRFGHVPPVATPSAGDKTAATFRLRNS